MATLRHLASRRDLPLCSRHLIGRAPACQLRLEDPGVSGYHAEIAWTGQAWTAQDLGSRNGTRLGARALPQGERARLSVGDELVIAGVVRLHFVDDAPPQLFARASDGELRVAVHELLSLPSDDEPELTLYRELDGRWWVELEASTRALEPLDTVIAGGRSWQVFSPASLPPTRELSGEQQLDQQRLRFAVSRDGEHIELTLESEAKTVSLEHRVHLSLLLVLARARLRDSADASLPEAEHGWVYREELPRMLGIQPELLSLWIHRARRQFAEVEIRDAASLFERRSGAGQLRIGVAALTIRDL